MVIVTAVAALKSLQSFVENKREFFDFYESKDKELSKQQYYENVRFRAVSVRLRSNDDDNKNIKDLPPKEKFRLKNFLPVIDKLSISLNNRIAAYESANEQFGFLGEIIEMNATDLKLKADNLISIYPDDFESSLADELKHLVSFAKEYKKHDNESTEVFCIEF